MKVLKSFNDAHSAIEWTTENKIEGAFIEITGALKSLGIGSIPTGRYHVVLDSNYTKKAAALIPSIVGRAITLAPKVARVARVLAPKVARALKPRNTPKGGGGGGGGRAGEVGRSIERTNRRVGLGMAAKEGLESVLPKIPATAIAATGAALIGGAAGYAAGKRKRKKEESHSEEAPKIENEQTTAIKTSTLKGDYFMFKVLKSFNDAHSAVYWLSQNRIEGASIEMTGTLKSMGANSVPSGNYHVVLNTQEMELDEYNVGLVYHIVQKAIMDVLKDSSLSEEDEERVKYPMTSTGERSPVERPKERQEELRAALTAANAQAAKEATEREAREASDPRQGRGPAGGAGRDTSGVVGPLSG